MSVGGVGAEVGGVKRGAKDLADGAKAERRTPVSQVLKAHRPTWELTFLLATANDRGGVMARVILNSGAECFELPDGPFEELQETPRVVEQDTSEVMTGIEQASPVQNLQQLVVKRRGRSDAGVEDVRND